MGVSFKEYLLEQKEAFFEKRYSSKEEEKDENRLSEKQPFPQKNNPTK